MRASGLEFIWEQRSPVIAINSSQDVQRLCAENQIGSLAELLSPFCSPLPKPVKVKRMNGQVQELPDFCVRFVDMLQLDIYTPSNLVDRVGFLIIKEFSKLIPDPKVLYETIDLIRDAKEPPNIDRLTPWFSEFRHAFCSSIGVQEYESFAHPVAIVHAVSTTSANPVSAALALLDPKVWPSALQSGGLIDPQVLVHILLVHDARVTDVDPQVVLSEIQKATSVPSCSLLVINSAAKEGVEPAKDKWHQFVVDRLQQSRRYLEASANSFSDTETAFAQNTPGFPERTGYLLSTGDVSSIESFVMQLTERHVIPFLEQQISLWSELLGAGKRGFTGRLFSASKKYFGGGHKTPLVPVAILGTTMEVYPVQSPESILRKLADYAFMIRDFRYANSIYESVLLDFQKNHPQSVRYILGAQQMIGLCQLVLRCIEPDRSLSGSFINALQSAGGGGGLVATKSAKHIFEVIFGSSKELSNPGASTSSPRSARSDNSEGGNTVASLVQHGSLLWHTVYLYYEALKACTDRSDLSANMLLGLIYHEVDQVTPGPSLLSNALLFEQAAFAFLSCDPPLWRRFAFRQSLAGDAFAKLSLNNYALRCFYQVQYMNLKWSHISDHVRYQLGELHTEPFAYYLDLAQKNEQSPELQEAFIEKAVVLAHQHKTSRVEGVHLPKVVCQQLSYEAALNEQNIPGSKGTARAAESMQWLELERSLVEDGLNPQLDADKLPLLPEPDGSRSQVGDVFGAIGESLFCHISFANTLKVDIQLSKVYLVVGVINDDRTVTIPTIDIAKVDPASDVLNLEHCDVDFMPLIFLPGQSQLSFALKVVPQTVGRLRVLGLCYNLFGSIPCFRELKTGPNSVSSLDIKVSSPMPAIEAKVSNLPNALFSGQIASGTLDIVNKSNAEFAYLTAKISHASFLTISSTSFAHSLDGATASESPYRENNERNYDSLELENDLDATKLSIVRLAGDSSKKLLSYKVWLRGDKIGKHSVKVLVGFKSKDSPQNGYRTTSFVVNLQVLPCLRINAFTRPCSTNVQEYILGLEVENLQADKATSLEQLVAVSNHWKMQPLNQLGPQLAVINPRETVVLFYRFSPCAYFDESCKQPEKCADLMCANQLQQFVTRREQVGRKFSKNKWLGSAYGKTRLYASLWNCMRTSTDPFSPLLVHFMLAARTNWRLSNLKAGFPFISAKLHPLIFPRYNSDDVDLTLFWSMGPEKIRGHHFVIGINLGMASLIPFCVSNALVKEYSHANPSEKGPLPIKFVHSPTFTQFLLKRALFDQTAKEKIVLLNQLTKMPTGAKDASPALIFVSVPERFIISGTYSTLTLTVDLVNSAWYSGILVNLEMDVLQNKSSDACPGLVNLTRPHYHWLGQTSFKGYLEPGEKRMLQFKVAVFSSGLYEFGNWLLTSSFAVNTKGGPVAVSSAYVQRSTNPPVCICESQSPNPQVALPVLV